MVYIYTLSTKEDPSNIRYVGKTSNPKDRLKRHLSNYYLNQPDYKARWLRKILNEGKTPILEILDEVPENEWQFWEQFWISLFKSWNFRLTNLTPGGDGVILTAEALKKRSQKMLGRKLSLETINKIKTSRKKTAEKNGYWLTEETKKKIQKTLTGYKHTQATKQKLSSMRQGKDNNFYNCTHSKKTIDYLKKISNRKKVIQLSIDDKIVNIFDSIRDAEKFTGISRRHISSCCNKQIHCNTAGGFKWKFDI